MIVSVLSPAEIESTTNHQTMIHLLISSPGFIFTTPARLVDTGIKTYVGDTLMT